jgi:hypothetical protein
MRLCFRLRPDQQLAHPASSPVGTAVPSEDMVAGRDVCTHTHTHTHTHARVHLVGGIHLHPVHVKGVAVN